MELYSKKQGFTNHTPGDGQLGSHQVPDIYLACWPGIFSQTCLWPPQLGFRSHLASSRQRRRSLCHPMGSSTPRLPRHLHPPLHLQMLSADRQTARGPVCPPVVMTMPGTSLDWVTTVDAFDLGFPAEWPSLRCGCPWRSNNHGLAELADSRGPPVSPEVDADLISVGTDAAFSSLVNRHRR